MCLIKESFLKEANFEQFEGDEGYGLRKKSGFGTEV
jgi:hypothetical protein